MKLLYLDSSALVKLVNPEPESRSLTELLADWPERISSALARVEVLRATRHATRRAGGDEDRLRRAEKVVGRVGLIRLDHTVLDEASSLGPPELRPLDAIHLATALSVGEDLGGMVCYDTRLAEAATGSGIEVLTPGVES